jgi:hypothetical protein
MSVSRVRLLALARKYRLLSEWRRLAAAQPSEALRPLAREFPGALRELDCLPLALLEQRLQAVLDAGRGEAPEPWIPWMLAYHERMRLALSAKRLLAGAQPSAQLLARVASQISFDLARPCAAEFVLRVAKPPRGRLNALVFELLEQELGEPRAELEQALFPRLSRR